MFVCVSLCVCVICVWGGTCVTDCVYVLCVLCACMSMVVYVCDIHSVWLYATLYACRFIAVHLTAA